MKNKSAIEELLSKKHGQLCKFQEVTSLRGGDINDSYKVDTNLGTFFLKENDGLKYPSIFRAESKGLATLQASSFKVPKVILTEDNFLVLEFLKKENATNDEYWQKFGQSLAGLHNISQSHFGFLEHKYIGSLTLINTRKETWNAFFIENRLEPQVRLALDNQKIYKETVTRFEKLYYKLENLFPKEKPSLLHGDLWNGNILNVEGNLPCIFDPAVYFGHREMDIAMTKLFGGFHPKMYRSYQDYYPLENGHLEREGLCNLYPLMVHVTLFGGDYENQVNRILKRFV